MTVPTLAVPLHRQFSILGRAVKDDHYPGAQGR
jgi:hypothetical protein